jgi:hypothetical protein
MFGERHRRIGGIKDCTALGEVGKDENDLIYGSEQPTVTLTHL